jgi:cytochrome c biogenesis protein CcmG/thiol:disulfide interchange protein DsbE
VSVRSSLAVVAVLAFVGLLTYGLLSKGTSGVALGDPAPTTSLPRLQGGGAESLSAYRGRWVLVNFWASWCVPCRQEAPELEEFQRQHGNKDFTVVGIDTRDLSGDGVAFVKKFGLSYPQLRDGNGDAGNEFGTTGVPENYLIAPDGRVRWLIHGPVSREYLRDAVMPIIEGKS